MRDSMLEKKKAFLFDMDGLLIDSEKAVLIKQGLKVVNDLTLDKVGKKLKCFESDGKNIEIAKLPSQFPAMNVTYTAVWQDKADVKYTVNFISLNSIYSFLGYKLNFS